MGDKNTKEKMQQVRAEQQRIAQLRSNEAETERKFKEGTTAKAKKKSASSTKLNAKPRSSFYNPMDPSSSSFGSKYR